MNLADPASLQRFLAVHGIKATKGLGQHFLCSESVAGTIVDAVRHCRGILEIGPGPGVLTASLAGCADRVVAIEVDERMIRALRTSAPSVDVLQADALNIDISEVLVGMLPPRAIVSNLPYYITTPLIEVIARARANYDVAVLMMQREVARRIMAPPRSGERGSLSVYLQSVFDIALIAEVSAALFLPPPKVDSTVLSFLPKREPSLTEPFFAFVRLGFAQPRKTLANNLVAGLHVSREVATALIERADLTPSARAQELTQADWVRLHNLATTA
ncbi:MAG: 16S rRNA (adenine(1518)-N(6)/adenine(1519)-N(6))-dimethyltransferase RsmA [Fimbriimonadaceae bacterium]